MACIELPSDRKLRKRIADGDYVDCSHWAEGEGRRWRLGDGKNHYQAGEEVVVGGVGPDFRWRKWLGKDRELRNELNKRGEMNDADKRGAKATLVADANVSEYSVSHFGRSQTRADDSSFLECLVINVVENQRKKRCDVGIRTQNVMPGSAFLAASGMFTPPLLRP